MPASIKGFDTGIFWVVDIEMALYNQTQSIYP